jgi:hypothetical protein
MIERKFPRLLLSICGRLLSDFKEDFMPTNKEQLNTATYGTKVSALGTRLDEALTLLRELHDDHATLKTVVDDLKTNNTNLRANLVALYTKMDADFADVANASIDYAAVLGAGGSNGDALVAAVSSSSPATLTAAKPTGLEG